MHTPLQATKPSTLGFARGWMLALAAVAATVCGPAWADAQLVAGSGKASAHLRFKIVVPPVLFVAVGPLSPMSSQAAKAAPCQAQVASVCVSGNQGFAQLVRSELPSLLTVSDSGQQAGVRVLYTAATP